MIKFFRKIRQRLLSENKPSKYLLYALGEILLIVIGILVALQINIWNENRKLLAAEKELYLKIIKDLDEEQKVLENQVQFSETLKSYYRKIYEYTTGKTDTLIMDQPSMLFISLNFSSLVLQNHENAVDKISSDSLRYDLNQYLLQAKELSTRRAEEIEDIKILRRPFLMENSIIDLDRMLNETTELNSVDLKAFMAAKNSANFERFIASGYASNQALIFTTNNLLFQNRELKSKIEDSRLLRDD